MLPTNPPVHQVQTAQARAGARRAVRLAVLPANETGSDGIGGCKVIQLPYTPFVPVRAGRFVPTKMLRSCSAPLGSALPWALAQLPLSSATSTLPNLMTARRCMARMTVEHQSRLQTIAAHVSHSVMRPSDLPSTIRPAIRHPRPAVCPLAAPLRSSQ